MITYDAIKSANERVNRLEISRFDKKTGKTITKHYACVAERVQAFKEICPEGCISTDLSFRETSDGKTMCICKASVFDENGKLLGTGHAYEIEGSTQINGTSFVENCESSAVGRALGFGLGLGSETSMATAEEMVNALYQQDEKAQITKDDKKALLVSEIKGLLANNEPVRIMVDKFLKGQSIESLEFSRLVNLRTFVIKSCNGSEGK